MKNLYLLPLALLLFASCVEMDEIQPQGETETEGTLVTRSVGEKDPYKLSLIQQALDEKLAQTRSARIVLQPTHLYVSFFPKDSAQVAILESLPIDTFYRPIGEEDYEIPEPDENDSDVYLPVYSVVPVNFRFPEEIEHRTIYEVYIQSIDGAGAASGEQLSPDLFRSVLSQTLAATGNGPLTRAAEQQPWNPTARVRFHIDINPDLDIADTLPLRKLTVMAYQGSNRHIRHTDSNGETDPFPAFIGHVDYQLNWDNEKFVIRHGNSWTRRTSPYTVGEGNNHLDTVITEANGLDYFLAGSHRALVAYFYEDYPIVEGLIKEKRNMEVGILYKEKRCTCDWMGRYIPYIRHPLALHADDQGILYPSSRAMVSTFHELGHASHCYNNIVDYGYSFAHDRRFMETWANGVGYAYTRALLGDEYVWNGTTNPDYTRLTECLILNGFKLSDIQFDFYGSSDWDQWKCRMTSREDLPISKDIVALIFDDPSTYHHDMRDLIVAADRSLHICQPTLLRLKQNTPFSIISWEVISGTGAKILQNNSAGFTVYFTEEGEKTIRATVRIAEGITQTYDTTVRVVNKKVLSAPAKVLANDECTIGLMPINLPNVTVTEWKVYDQNHAEDKALTVEPTSPTSALFSFEEGGLKTVKVKFRISPALPVIECETQINVEPRNAANIFEVIDKPARFQPNTTYRAQYKGSEKNVEVRAIGLNHNSKLPFIEFNTWSYNKSTKTITFLVNHHLNLDFDYTMLIFYTVNGVGVEDPAELVISNIRDHI